MRDNKTLQRIALLLILGIVRFAPAAAQHDTTAQKDIWDAYYKYLRKGRQRPLKAASRKSSWTVLPAVGFTPQTGFSAAVSANKVSFASADPKQNQSVLNAAIVGTSRQQLMLFTNHNIWTSGNRMVLIGDHRFFIHPQATFGLGGGASRLNENVIDYLLLRISQYAYRRLGRNWFAGGGYVLNHFFNISEEGNPDGSVSDFALYGAESQTTSSGLAAALLYDSRRNQNNPVAGSHFLNIQFLQNFRWLGSDQPWRSLLIDGRKYVPAAGNNKFAFWALGWFTFNTEVPYLELPSTGWDATNNMGRGYIQSRFRGQNLLYAEAEYRMTISRSGLLGAVVFANAQSVTDWPGNRFTRIHPAIGAGARIKLNKRSNTNLSIDYGFGMDGSRGLFINLAEVF